MVRLPPSLHATQSAQTAPAASAVRPSMPVTKAPLACCRTSTSRFDRPHSIPRGCAGVPFITGSSDDRWPASWGRWISAAPGGRSSRGLRIRQASIRCGRYAICAAHRWTSRCWRSTRGRRGPCSRTATPAAGSFWSATQPHLNPPWGGHGFNTCVGDAVNLAWKIAAVLRGHAGPRLLASYEIERRPVAQQTIDVAAAQEAFLAPAFAKAGLDDDTEHGRQLRDQVAHTIRVAKRSEFYSLGLVLGYDYPHSPVVWTEPREAAPTVELCVHTERASRRPAAACVARGRPVNLRPAWRGVLDRQLRRRNGAVPDGSRSPGRVDDRGRCPAVVTSA